MWLDVDVVGSAGSQITLARCKTITYDDSSTSKSHLLVCVAILVIDSSLRIAYFDKAT